MQAAEAERAMSDADHGTVGEATPEPTLRAEALAARLAEVKVLAIQASAMLRNAQGAHVALMNGLAGLSALIGEPTEADLKRALTRLRAAAGVDEEAPPKPRILTD